MLYFLFLYQMESGELLYEKEFQPNIDSQMDLFGSFFSALKTFISNVAEDKKEELKTIGLGKLIASIIRIIEVNIDMVIIAETGDKKEIQKLSSDLKEIVVKYKDLFSVEVIKTEKFENFDKEITTIVLTHRKVLDTKALEEKQKDLLKSVWEQRGKFSEKIRLHRKELEQDRINLVNEIQNEKNVISKLSLCKQVLELSDKLEDEQVFIVYQNMAKKLVNDIKDQKLRLNYYLKRIQDALKISLNKLEGDPLTGDYKEIYTNLYSFSSKLKDFAPEDIYKKYYDLANKLVYIKGVSSEEFSKVINEISNMDENIESYLR
jgi:hypothetical protein